MGCPGTGYLNRTLSFSIVTHDPNTGDAADATGSPIYRIYTTTVETPILTGTLSKFDDVNTTGLYEATITCSTANGFVHGTSYTIYIEASVNGVIGGISYGFIVEDLALLADKVTLDLIYTRVSTLSLDERLDSTLPVSSPKASVGDKYIQVDMYLYDNDGNLFDSRDYDGGDFSTSAHYVLLDRVYPGYNHVSPFDNNVGQYFFQITTWGGIDAGVSVEPDWSSIQTPGNTIVDGNGNTWTNIGSTIADPSALKNGFGVVATDDQGISFPLYSDNIGTLLPVVNQCKHHSDTIKPQKIPRISHGIYKFWLNLNANLVPKNVHFFIGWFDKARWETTFLSSDHHRKIFQMQITETVPDLLQQTLDRLLELKVDGTLAAATPPTNSEDLTLYQYNDYAFELSLNILWSTYLDGSYDVYFTIMETMNATTYLAESVCTILSQDQATIRVPLTVTQMNIPVGSYIWQIQLRQENANPLLAPASLKVVAFGKTYVRPTLKKGLPAPTP